MVCYNLSWVFKLFNVNALKGFIYIIFETQIFQNNNALLIKFANIVDEVVQIRVLHRLTEYRLSQRRFTKLSSLVGRPKLWGYKLPVWSLKLPTLKFRRRKEQHIGAFELLHKLCNTKLNKIEQSITSRKLESCRFRLNAKHRANLFATNGAPVNSSYGQLHISGELTFNFFSGKSWLFNFYIFIILLWNRARSTQERK